jgi:parallel beta-helix repeat protein
MAVLAAMAVSSASPAPGSGPGGLEILVDSGDASVLQAAVDRAGAAGGGTLRLSPGRTVLRHALVLRSGVRIEGTPGQTILAACDGAKSPLACDGDCNERQITLADPSEFRVGDGVAVRDAKSSSGFAVTTATLTAQIDPRTFRLSAPLYLDYMVSDKAAASLSFPVIGGWGIRNASLEGLTIEGNRATMEKLDGCRGGGIYLFECDNVTIRRCRVRNYNGDGISFQSSGQVTVEDCVAEGNSGLGLHPGSGSQHPALRRNRSTGNGGDGLYVCWRVKFGVFEDNEIRGNGGVGISIGHKDTDNVFRNNTIVENSRTGILFRNESEPMGAHRNVFERNTILDNGRGPEGKGSRACVTLVGHHDDVVFRDNTIGNSGSGGPAGVGFSVGKDSRNFVEESNRFSNLEAHREVGK